MRKLLFVMIFSVFCAGRLPAQEEPFIQPGETLAGLLEQTPEFSVFAELMGDAGLLDILREAGPYTVFAPNNSVFEEFPEGALEELMEDPEDFERILLYHIVEARLDAFNLLDLEQQEVLTMAGEPVLIRLENGLLRVDEAAIVLPDYEAGNGIIHEINGLLLPLAED